MKARPEHQALLLDLQAIDTKLGQLDHREKNLPQLAVLAELTRQRDALLSTQAERRGALEDVQTELTRLESDVAVVETRIARDKERLQGTASVKDVAALEQELAALQKRHGDLEEIEFTVMERLEERESELAETTAAVADLDAQVGAAEAERDAGREAIAAERENTVADRRVLITTIPSDLLSLYEKQRSRYGYGASLLRFGVSSATGVALLADELAAVRAAAPDDVVLCPSSDAILVRTAESGL
jgi:predicted  nucleic acid-binding Zn-ribbon protein